jgi:hypothetical protein
MLGARSTAAAAMLDVNLKAPEHYINRELSFLDFNQRTSRCRCSSASVFSASPARISTSSSKFGLPA